MHNQPLKVLVFENGSPAGRTFNNALLRLLGADSIGRLHLRPVRFELRHELEYPGKPIDHLFFVEHGMASMTATFENGSQVEVSTFGPESVIGVSALMGTKRSLNRVYTQIEGYGYSSPTEVARLEFALGGNFQRLALRSVQMQLIETAQSAGCNAKHSVEQRLARWLLICADRSETRTLKMSHEFLADMLGATRSTISLAAEVFRQEGMIRYQRGVVELTDIAGLRERTCECYGVVRNHLDSFAEFEPGPLP